MVSMTSNYLDGSNKVKTDGNTEYSNLEKVLENHVINEYHILNLESNYFKKHQCSVKVGYAIT